MYQLLQDCRFALRTARRAPLVPLAVVLSVALGVAATTTVVTLVNGLLLRPLPLPGADRLYMVDEQRTGAVRSGPEGMRVPYTRFLAYRSETSHVFSGLAGQAGAAVTLRAPGGSARNVTGALVTANYFAVLGVRPALGAFFASENEPQLVLGHGAWTNQFGADPHVVGRPAYLDGRAYTVVGVAPRGFLGTTAGKGTDVWIPARVWGNGRIDVWLSPLGRLRPGVSAGRAGTLVDLVARRTPPDEPQTRVKGALLHRLTAVPQQGVAQVAGYLAALFATALLVLLIAAANVAGVLGARGVARRQELAVRLAAGAGRWRLVRQLLTESTLLFLGGGALGVLLAREVLPLASRYNAYFGVPASLAFMLDARVLAFALGLTLLVALAAGVLPALQATRGQIVAGLGEGGARGTTRATRRAMFVAAQLAMAVVLLVSAALLVRSLRNALVQDPGYDPEGVVVASVNTWTHGYDEARGRAFFTRLIDAVRAVPGVESVGLTLVPAGIDAMCNDVEPVVTKGSDQRGIPACYSIVDPGYFRTIRLQLIAGRAIQEGDRAGAPDVAVVNQTLARKLWPSESPVGQRYRSAGKTYTIVGVARDARFGSYTAGAFAYYAYAQQYSGLLMLHARVRGDIAPYLPRIREIVRQLDPELALQVEQPLTTMLRATVVPQRVASAFIGGFGLVGLLLAALGIYGVLAFQVAQRTREIGIRMALGAGAREIRRLVLRRGVKLAAIGVALGMLGAAGLTWLLGSLLVGVSPFDLVSFLGVPLLMIAVALLASWLPARRACAIEPMTAIRVE